MTIATMRLPLTNSDIAEVLEACKQHLAGHVNQVDGTAITSNYLCNAVKIVCAEAAAAEHEAAAICLSITTAVHFTIAKALAPRNVLVGKYWNMLDAHGTAVTDPDYRIFRDLWLDAVIADLLASSDEVQSAAGWPQ